MSELASSPTAGQRSSLPPEPEPLRIPVADSHTHLDMQEPGPAAAVDAAARVGVTTLIQVGTDVPSSHWSARTAARYDGVWATVALHPNEAPRLGDLEAAIAEIEQLAALRHVVGVGETGLDYYRTDEPGRPVQEESFRRHIEIAKRHDKALVIHDRDAHEDVLRVLDEEGAPDRVVFHCFSGDAEMAKVCAENGYFVSFAGNVTYKTAQHLRDALAVTPLDRVLVETDAPFLTPVPYRGKPNAPYLIPVTLRAMAEVRGVGEDDMAAAVGENARRAFALDA